MEETLPFKWLRTGVSMTLQSYTSMANVDSYLLWNTWPKTLTRTACKGVHNSSAVCSANFGNLDTQHNFITSTPTTKPLTSSTSLAHIFTYGTSALSLRNKFGLNKRSKHIALRYLFAQDTQATGLVNIQRVRLTRIARTSTPSVSHTQSWNNIFVLMESLS